MPRSAPVALAALVAAGATIAACTNGGTSISATKVTAPTSTTTVLPRGNVDGVLRLGALLPTTGDGSILGPPLLAGVRLAVEQINQAGGVNGRPVELTVADETGDPSNAAAALNQLVDQGMVDAIIGPVSTRVTLSLLGPITAAKVVACSPTNTAITLSDYPDDDYYFRTAPPDSLEAVALGRMIAGTGARSTALLYVDDDYGRGFANQLEGELRRQGNEVVAKAAIDPTADYADTLRPVLQQDPGAIAYVGVADPGVRVIATLRQLGVGQSSPIFVTDGMRQADLASRLAAFPPGIVAGIHGLAISPVPAGSSWFTDALTAFDPDAPTLYAAYSYDCTNLIALAAQSVRTDDPVVFRGAMLAVSQGGVACRDFADCRQQLLDGRNIDLDGASGPIELGPSGDPEWGAFDLFRLDEAGRAATERQISVRKT